MILKPRSGSAGPLTARILPERPVCLALFDSDHAICTNIPGLLEYYAIISATDEERRTLVAAGASTRDQ